MDEHREEDPPPGFYPCEVCGQPVVSKKAYASMETLDVFCTACLREKLRRCDRCGKPIFVSAYQHLPTGGVLCEPCVLRVFYGEGVKDLARNT